MIHSDNVREIRMSKISNMYPLRSNENNKEKFWCRLMKLQIGKKNEKLKNRSRLEKSLIKVRGFEIDDFSDRVNGNVK